MEQTAETSFLCIVSDEAQTLLLILDDVCGYRGMVRDLFYKEICAAAVVGIGPLTVK